METLQETAPAEGVHLHEDIVTHHVVPDMPIAQLVWLAVGAFAIGTEGFMIAAILPDVARDLQVTVASAGQLVTIFAIAYAISSPILTTLTAKMHRRTLLLAAIWIFALSNLVAALAPNYWALVGARILLAFSAGLYVPGANALAGALVAHEQRGRAIAIVNAGITLAIAFGVPLGAVIGGLLNWQSTFVAVAVLSAVAGLGILFNMPSNIGHDIRVPGMRERLAALGDGPVLLTLVVTCLWATGAYTIYTYVAEFMRVVIAVDGARIGSVLFLWGAASAVGLFISGVLVDRLGEKAVIAVTLLLTIGAMWSMASFGTFLSPTAAFIPTLVAVAVWGASHWGFWPAQQARLLELGGVSVASITLSMNASFLYLGFSLGAALGSVTLQYGGPVSLGFVGGACVAASLVLFAIGWATIKRKPL